MGLLIRFVPTQLHSVRTTYQFSSFGICAMYILRNKLLIVLELSLEGRHGSILCFLKLVGPICLSYMETNAFSNIRTIWTVTALGVRYVYFVPPIF